MRSYPQQNHSELPADIPADPPPRLPKGPGRQALPPLLSPVLDETIAGCLKSLGLLQNPDGHWIFSLEGDSTITSEYILTQRFAGESIDQQVESQLRSYLLNTQASHNGWALYPGGDFNQSASVKAYCALKALGEDINADHMSRARAAILAHGGAAKCNVLTRYWLALFEQLPWQAVPTMLVECILFPRWFPFHLSKVSSWARNFIVTFSVLAALKPKPKQAVSISELFVVPPEQERSYNTNPTGSTLGNIALMANWLVSKLEPLIPRGLRHRAIDEAVKFICERLNGSEGIAGIFPPMAGTVMVFQALGYRPDHPHYRNAKLALDKFLVLKEGQLGFCQPSISPVWDTALASHALMELSDCGVDAAVEADRLLRPALEWLQNKQILEFTGDWAQGTLNPPRPGGWSFQYHNLQYPDLDDTAVVAMALHRADKEHYLYAIERAAEWILGLQSRNGGWAAYDVDNTYYYLNHIPFADHGAMLDPPSADVTARCVSFLSQLGCKRSHPALGRAERYLLNEQEEDGSWFGRWGTNYIYGTWSVLCALNALGVNWQCEPVRRAVSWLVSRQRADGGWGEDCATYWADRKDECKESTASQTSWALLGLMAAGEVDNPAVERGIVYLLQNAPQDGARWHERLWNAVGFPRVFYLTYHGYAAYFPLWALSRYRSLKTRGARRVRWGM